MPQTAAGSPAQAGVASASAASAAAASAFAGRHYATAAIVLTLALIAGVLVFIVLRYLRRDLRSAAVIKQTHRLHDQAAALVVEASKLPATLNGQELAYSFWLYLPSFATLQDPMLVFRRQGGSAAGNPVVFLDNGTNKLYIALATNKADTGGAAATAEELRAIAARTARDAHLLAVVEYVPLQRWVHVAFSAQDSLLTVYLDGDLYTVENVADVAAAGQARPIVAATAGDLQVGAPTASAAGFAGYVARMQVFNYALSQRDVQKLYNSGPRGGNCAPAALGLSGYGVRSPLYRLDEPSAASASR